MMKFAVAISIAITVIAVGTISFNIAFADESGKNSSNATALAIKVANSLGLDVGEVDEAIKQAHEELRAEAIQKKIDLLVEKGWLTEDKANNYFNRIQSSHSGIPTIRDHFPGKMRHHKGWDGHGAFKGSEKCFHRAFSLEAIQDKLNFMAENGYMTKEEAEEKLRALQAKHSEKPVSH